MFKEMGLSLGEIRELLARQSTAAELREVFRERRSALLKRMQEDSRRLARIDTRMRALQGHRNAALPEVQLRQTQPVWVVSLREKIHRYEEAEAMFEEVERRAGTARVSGARAALWHSCANEGPTIDCEVLRFLKQPASLRGNLRTFQMSAATVASVFHFGGDRTIEDSYRALATWLSASSTARGRSGSIDGNTISSGASTRRETFPQDSRCVSSKTFGPKNSPFERKVEESCELHG